MEVVKSLLKPAQASHLVPNFFKVRRLLCSRIHKQDPVHGTLVCCHNNVNHVVFFCFSLDSCDHLCVCQVRKIFWLWLLWILGSCSGKFLSETGLVLFRPQINEDTQMSKLSKNFNFLSFRFAVSKVVRHISFGHNKFPFHDNKHKKDTLTAFSWPIYKSSQLAWLIFYRD